MSDLIEGPQQEPEILIAYGPPGVGKSTFASGAPSPLFVGPERNGSLNALKAPRSKSHDQLCQQIRDVQKGKYDHKQIRTLVLDSIDMHEKVIHSEIVAKEPGKSMATAMKGFGKAYNFAGTKLFEVRDLMDELREKKETNLIVLGHSIVTKFSDPMLNIEYDQYEMCLHKTKRQDYNSIFMDWANNVFFLTWKSFRTEDGSGAVSMGQKEIRTEFRPSHYAKNRYNLPESIPMLDDSGLVRARQKPQTFGVIEQYINDFYSSGAVANTFQNDFNILSHECKKLMGEVADTTILPVIEAAINTELTTVGDLKLKYSNLTVIKNRLNEIVSNQ